MLVEFTQVVSLPTLGLERSGSLYLVDVLLDFSSLFGLGLESRDLDRSGRMYLVELLSDSSSFIGPGLESRDLVLGLSGSLYLVDLLSDFLFLFNSWLFRSALLESD